MSCSCSVKFSLIFSVADGNGVESPFAELDIPGDLASLVAFGMSGLSDVSGTDGVSSNSESGDSSLSAANVCGST
jgi:hypothetical protein